MKSLTLVRKVLLFCTSLLALTSVTLLITAQRGEPKSQAQVRATLTAQPTATALPLATALQVTREYEEYLSLPICNFGTPNSNGPTPIADPYGKTVCRAAITPEPIDIDSWEYARLRTPTS